MHLTFRTAPLALLLACSPDGGGEDSTTAAPVTTGAATDTPTTDAPETTVDPGTTTVDPGTAGDPPDPTTGASTTTTEASTTDATTGEDPTTGAALGCADLPLCDDFEAAAVDGPPDPALWTVSSPNCSGTGTLRISAEQAHRGAQALRVDGGGTYCDHVFIAHTAALATVGPQVYGRLHVRLDAALGDGHVTFLTLRDSNDAGGKDLRMGGQSKIAMWNRESDDATLPSLSPAGIALSVALAAQQWTCVEFMIDQDAGALTTWIDGVEIAGLRIDGEPTPDVDQQWLNKPDWQPALADLKVGWESYAGQTMTLYFDDIALAGARIGCAR